MAAMPNKYLSHMYSVDASKRFLNAVGSIFGIPEHLDHYYLSAIPRNPLEADDRCWMAISIEEMFSRRSCVVFGLIDLANCVGNQRKWDCDNLTRATSARA